jgi:prolyl-tRNA editing enzyme YbaK/EbsC (Cys-tRNA(Pro) deacylase)
VSLASVRADLAVRAPDLVVLQTTQRTATVAEAAQAHGVEPGRIAKTLAFRVADGRTLLLVAAGDARIDNARFKAAFGKGKMLPAEEVAALTGHPVGGVCPFGLTHPIPVYLDRSLQAWDEVLPAGGSVDSAVRLTLERLEALTAGEWVAVCTAAAAGPSAAAA